MKKPITKYQKNDFEKLIKGNDENGDLIKSPRQYTYRCKEADAPLLDGNVYKDSRAVWKELVEHHVGNMTNANNRYIEEKEEQDIDPVGDSFDRAI
ncbi:hypothetical protein M0802_000775 [Mischocyttarus mexicanus]|nr:hypothetical protein M0802_000775 [Mischocyttarus mexicanus]